MNKSTFLFVVIFSTNAWASYLDDGKVLKESVEFSCGGHTGGKGSCIFRNEYHEDLEIYEGVVRLKILYDSQGPYLGMNVSVEGSGTTSELRYAVAIKQTDFNDEIVYKGDGGYDMCCRFLHDVSCSWKHKSLTPDSRCSFESFTGSVAKPLHHHQDGPWSAKLIFISRGEELGYVEFPFSVSIKDLGQIVSLKKLWENPYGLLVVSEPKNNTNTE